ncbi:acyltransferase family protein [Lysobacter niabensis]|uniref:acyltransferase family protein n=1 Tax=Agrilutibacter niabensis TaxID=380628 RepID=UPI00360FDBB9
MSTKVQLARAGRYGHIDAMRAVAVLLVVVAHAGLGHIVPGGSGVTIFFAISGFIITHLVLREHARTGGFDVGRFYFRRLLKLAPPFVVIVAIPTTIYCYWNPVRLTDFLAQMFFWFNWVYMSGNHDVLPGSGVVWSLAVEEQFYIVFALMWLWLVRSPKRLVLLGVLAALAAAGSLCIRLYIAETGFSHNRVYYGTDTRIDGIAIGVFAAVLFSFIERHPDRFQYVRRALSSDWVVALASCGYLFSLLLRDEYFRETFRYSIQALCAAALVVYGLIQTESGLRRLMQCLANVSVVQTVGLASYSIYLVHLSLNHLLLPVLAGWPKASVVILLSVLGMAAGVMIWRLIEVPVESYKRRFEARGIGSTGGGRSNADLTSVVEGGVA